jgi:uncharacterized membrane-anchored protein YhcB (DUF1043 family)
MHSNKIGEKVALFWIAWAWVTEKAENFKLTDQIFQKGKAKKAEPKDLLKKRYDHFRRRMVKHFLERDEHVDQLDDDHLLPPSQTQTQALSRSALNILSQTESRNRNTNARPMHQASASSVRSDPRSVSSSAPLSSHSATNIGFAIFSDGMTNTNQAIDEELPDSLGWNNLPKRSQTTKENDGNNFYRATIIYSLEALS